MAEDSAMPPRTAPMGPHEWVPVPDPTVLTTQALYREVSSLRELIELRIEDLSGLLDEKFLRTEQQFELVERQRVEQKNDTKNAVDAALTAQKEAAKEQTVASDRAIAKSEAAITKQLEQQRETFGSAQDEARRTMDEMKTRIGDLDKRITSNSAAGVGQRQGGLDARTVGFSMLMAVLGIAGLLYGILKP